MVSSKSDFIHIFNDFIHVYSPRGKGRKPLGDKHLMWIENLYHFAHSLQVLKKKKSDLIHILNDLIYVYSPRARADNSLGTNL